MKRTLIIAGGALIILAVLGVWLYLLLFDRPGSGQEVFSDLGFEVTPQDTVEVIDQPLPQNEDYTVDVQDGLQQLTTRPVAGFVAINSTSSDVVRYVEQGTGHMFEIDLLTGEETMISRTTLPRVSEAVLSPDGKYAALTANSNNLSQTYVGAVNHEEQTFSGIDNALVGIDNIHLTNTNIYYTFVDSEGSRGFTYQLDTTDDTELIFTAPFRSITTIWNKGETYFYNRPADNLLGYLYRVNNGSYKSTDGSGYGFIADMSEEFEVDSNINDGVYRTNYIDRKTGQQYKSPITHIPEKCIFSTRNSSTTWCAGGINDSLMINDWYKGVATSEDYLWKVDIVGESALLLLDLANESGRPIDVTGLATDSKEARLYFVNKFDNSLWKYDL